MLIAPNPDLGSLVSGALDILVDTFISLVSATLSKGSYPQVRACVHARPVVGGAIDNNNKLVNLNDAGLFDFANNSLPLGKFNHSRRRLFALDAFQRI